MDLAVSRVKNELAVPRVEVASPSIETINFVMRGPHIPGRAWTESGFPDTSVPFHKFRASFKLKPDHEKGTRFKVRLSLVIDEVQHDVEIELENVAAE